LTQFRHSERIETLQGALEGLLRARMTNAGWHADPTAILGTGDGVVGHFRHPLNDDFAATACFAWLGDFPPLKVDTAVGVSYQRTYHVWPYLLNGYPCSELRVGAEDLGQVSRYVELWEQDEVDRAVDQLVTPVLDHAVDWAAPFASVEALLAALRTSDDDVVRSMEIPVVLAAAGRSEEARQALADALLLPRDSADERYMDRFAARFRDWLASGAPASPPDSAP
jgi:hypothetical protein